MGSTVTPTYCWTTLLCVLCRVVFFLFAKCKHSGRGFGVTWLCVHHISRGYSETTKRLSDRRCAYAWAFSVALASDLPPQVDLSCPCEESSATTTPAPFFFPFPSLTLRPSRCSCAPHRTMLFLLKTHRQMLSFGRNLTENGSFNLKQTFISASLLWLQACRAEPTPGIPLCNRETKTRRHSFSFWSYMVEM